MKGSSERPGFVAPLLVAIVFVLVFGLGIFVGKPAPARIQPAGKTSVKPVPVAEEAAALAACRQELETRSKAQAIASAAASRLLAVKQAAPEAVPQIQALEEKLEACQTRDIVGKADICGSANRYSIVMMALLYGDKSCVDKAGTGDFIVRNYDKCPEFDDIPDDWTPDDYHLSAEERRRVINAAHDHKRFNRERTAGFGEFVISSCLEKYGASREGRP